MNKDKKKNGLVARIMNPNTQIVKYGKWYSIAPAVIILAGILVVLLFGLNLGLDFTGGRIVTVSGFAEGSYAQTRTIVEGEMKAMGVSRTEVQKEEKTSGEVVMSVKFPDPKGLDIKNEAEVNTFFSDLEDSINAKLAAAGLNSITIEESDSLSASASNEKIMNVFVSVATALILVLLYMVFRFKFNSGVAAIIGLLHDVLIMAALVAFFRIQVNFIFVAAAITIVAYSLNNTLVLFDRVRTKEKDIESRLSTAQIVDTSIKETLGRTLAMTVSTVIPVLILAIFGVPAIQEFAIPILFGLLAGTYSTIFLTSSVYVRFENAKKRRAGIKVT